MSQGFDDRLVSAARVPWPPWVHRFVWGITALLVVVFASILQLGGRQNVWDGWQESSGLRHPNYREQVNIDAVFRTRANTWSNLAYIVVGLYAVALGWHDRRLPLTDRCGYLLRTPALSVMFGFACCSLGFGSGLFHASLTRIGQQIDVAAMYTPLLVLIALNIGRRVPSRWQNGLRGHVVWVSLAILVIAVGGYLFVYKWSMSSFVVLSSLILSVALCVTIDQFPRSSRLDQRWLVVSTCTLVAALVCRELDIEGRFSSPTSWLQGHALWHVLTSVSLAGLYGYYRSEVGVRRSADGPLG